MQGYLLTLQNLDKGKNNNLNLLRFLAAALVLYSHCYPLLYGNNQHEPLYKLATFTLGNLAVFVFFSISGYLVTASYLRTNTCWQYILKRALRIYPALFVAIVSCTILGLFMTSYSAKDYALSPETYAFLIKNSILVSGLHYHLPGVFETNPYPEIVNGSLWTLPIEITLYAIILAAGLFRILGKRLMFAVLLLCTFAYTIIYPSEQNNTIPFFLTGTLFQLYRDKIVITWPLFLLSIAAVISMPILGLAIPLIAIPLTYSIMFLAFYAKNALVLRFNHVGDYSYGLYIYAFPVQQLLIKFGIGSFLQLFFLAFIITFILAFLSWTFIEKPSLKFKMFFVNE